MTDKPLDDVWYNRDLPVLVEIARRLEAGTRAVTVDDVAQALSMPTDLVQRSLEVLRDRELIQPGKAGPGPVAYAVALTSEAYFLTGLHPSGDDAITNLVNMLRQAADKVDDANEKTQLRKLADGFLGISKNVASGVLTAFINQQINS